jgi:hypothetical protein
MWYKLTLPLLALGALAVVVGCYQGGNDAPAEGSAAPPVPAADAEHGHKQGDHGGRVVPIGRDNYHAEVLFEKDGAVRLYTLGKDEARELEVEQQVLQAHARAADAAESLPVELKPQPQNEDSAGKTSRFAGQLPAALRGKAVELSVRIAIGGERFRFSARSPEPEHAEAMPAKVSDDAERKLYLTPGGKYTQADVEANGRRTASQAFRGAKPSHDAKPKVGDRLCPISETKANTQFRWVIDGQRYEFCCPPCVDEFLTLAKEHPEAVKPAAEYVKTK